MQLTLFEVDAVAPKHPSAKPLPCATTDCERIELAELFEAYYTCRVNKRRTANALAFEVNLEENLLVLWREINQGRYRPGRSIAFIVDTPVKREIFAAEFRDRIVHHLIIDKLNPLFEREFIHDSYASRVGKGTLFGVRRLESFIQACSENDTRDTYVLRLDIAGFFMHINRTMLFARLERFIYERYPGTDRGLLIELVRIVIFNDVRSNCAIRGNRSDWVGLPASKSLFGSPPGCGLPIGNLTSQIFANFYLNSFDHFVKHELGVRYYGRYVDDLVLVHRDNDYLRGLIPVLRKYLAVNLGLELHPRKIRLQHHTHGTTFLGAVVKPRRIYIGNRAKGNFYAAIVKHGAAVAGGRPPTQGERKAFRASVNSYLGLMRHYNTRRLRRSMFGKHVGGWWRYGHVAGGLGKFVLTPERSRRGRAP